MIRTSSSKAKILVPRMGQLLRPNNVRSISTGSFRLTTISDGRFQERQPFCTKIEMKRPATATFRTTTRSFHASQRVEDSYPPHILFPMPALSPTMEMGSISKWNVKEGEAFSAGDSLCEVQTDKATVDFEAQDDGILARILSVDGEDIKVGVPICVVVEEDDDVAAFKDFTVESEAGSAQPTEAAPAAPAAPTETVSAPAAATHNLGDFVLTPAARHNSQSQGLDATVLYPGTGKDGRVTKGDFLTALKNGVSMPALSTATTSEPSAVSSTPASTAIEAAPTPAPAVAATSESPPLSPPPSPDPNNTFTDVPNNNMRKVIAKRLTESKSTVPHFYTTSSISLDAVLALRKKLAAQDIKFSVNDAIIRSSALALRDVPEMNATFSTKTQAATISPTIDISVAVATPTGLITPIVTNANERGLIDISTVVKDLATRARENKLLPTEYQGGSFTISNLGMFGINEFSAVINPPQAAILAVGGGVKTIVPTLYDETKEVQDKVTTQVLMEARLSADRRVVDEATAGLFMQALKYYLGRPELLVL